MAQASLTQSTAAQPVPEASTRRRRPSLADAVFVLLLAVTVPIYVSRLNGYEFRGDDWRLFQRGHTLGDYFEPYNGHLSAVPIAIYRFLLETFGLRSTLPLRLVDVAGLAMVATAMFLVVRFRVGSALGLVAGATMLWYPRLSLTPSAFNHWLALAAIIVCSWALTSERRYADVLLGAGLTFALCSSGVGAAGAVGCLTYVVLSRAPLRRWLVVAIPAAGYAVWWTFLAVHGRGSDPRTFTESIHFVVDGVFGSFRGLVVGSRVLGIALVLLFVGNLAWRLRGGLRNACHELSWSAALFFWWIGLAYSRSSFSSGAYRYQLVGSAFVILAFLPARPVEPLFRRLGRVEPIVAATIVIALVVFVNRGDIYLDARRLEAEGRFVRQQLVAANLGADIVPDNATLALYARQNSNARTYRELTGEFGLPDATRTSMPDSRIIQLGRIGPISVPEPPDTPCLPLGQEPLLSPTSRTMLHADDRDVVVQLRRFGDEWVTIGRIPSGATALLDLPGLQSAKPWMLHAPGSCRVRDAPAATIVVPEPGAELVGTVALAARTQNVYTTKVEFHLSGDGLEDSVIGNATPGYGWILRWDTTSVPNGAYELTSVAYDSAGNPDTSDAVAITVAN